MIIGLSVPVFTVIHVVITLIAIVSGFIVVFGMIGSHRLPRTTALFWIMTVLTTVSGFLFFLSPTQVKALTPAAATGIVATIVFAIGLFALYARHLYGAWRWIYAITATISLYLNVFVLITQSFGKLTVLNPAVTLKSMSGMRYCCASFADARAPARSATSPRSSGRRDIAIASS